MKKSIVAFALTLLFIASATAGEVNYYNKSWADVVAKAKAEHKYIFIDCYTSWCGWCKIMDAQTMTDSTVYSTLNDKFIAIKMDMEHGEGIKLAMKYHISGYPSFMYFNPSGEYVYQSTGYMVATDFIKELINAQDKSKQLSAPGYTASIDLDYPEFFKNLFTSDRKKNNPKTEEVTTYLDKQSNLYSEVNWAIIARLKMNEKYTKFFLNNLHKYDSLYGHTSVSDKVSAIISGDVSEAAKAKDEKKFRTALLLADKYASYLPEDAKTDLGIMFYRQTENWPKLVTEINNMISKKGYENADFINSVSWAIYEKCDDKKSLQQATEWMKHINSSNPKYANMDTYAALLYKAGQPIEAKAVAEKAIELGKKEGENTEATETLLKKITTNTK